MRLNVIHVIAFSVHPILMLTYSSGLWSLSGVCPQGFPTEIFYNQFTSPLCLLRYVHFIPIL